MTASLYGRDAHMGKFKLNNNADTKVLDIELEGSFSEEDGLRSILAYQQIVNPIDSRDYELQIDCRKLNVTAPDVVPILAGCFVMFKNDGFIKVHLTLENNPTLKMQLVRLGRKAGLENLVFHSSVREAQIS